jgi:hypothetical protein
MFIDAIIGKLILKQLQYKNSIIRIDCEEINEQKIQMDHFI